MISVSGSGYVLLSYYNFPTCDKLKHSSLLVLGIIQSPGQTSRRKLAKSELVKSGQTDSQVAKGRKFHAYTGDLQSTCVDLRWGGQTVKNSEWVDLRTNLSSTKVNATQQQNSGTLCLTTSGLSLLWTNLKEQSGNITLIEWLFLILDK